MHAKKKMPEYDENFLLDCSNFEKQRWKSYNFKFKFKALDTNSNYLPTTAASSVKYSPLRVFDSAIAVAGGESVNGDYRHSVFGYPPAGSNDISNGGGGNEVLTPVKCKFLCVWIILLGLSVHKSFLALNSKHFEAVE